MTDHRPTRFWGASRAHLALIVLCLIWSTARAGQPAPATSLITQGCEQILNEHAQRRASSFDPRRPTVIVVDGYSSGRHLPVALRDADLDGNMQIVHVHASGAVPKNFEGSFWSGTYEKSIAYHGNFAALIEELNRIEVIAVLPGTDTGVLLNDQIATTLNRARPHIPSNGIVRGRKDKFKMQEIIRQHGLDSIRQKLSADVTTSLRWVRQNGLLDTPGSGVVVKPLMSAGGEGVYFPKSEEEIRSVFQSLLGFEDGLGNMNTQLLTQELVTGVEYVLNSTVWDGRVVYTDIWQYHKRLTADGRWIYWYDVLLPYEGELQDTLRAYDREVIKALGIRYGNSHSEIMMVEERGPVLIESNNRPMGATQPIFAQFATGRNQIGLSALAITNPSEFARLSEAYPIRENAIVYTIANLHGRPMRLRADARERLRRVPGFFQDFLHVDLGSVLPPTEDMFTQIGEVWLKHEDMGTLMRAVRTLEQMERNGELFLDI